jgi:metallo-beta-lactamase class B
VSVAPGLWMHVTLDPVSRFPSNGMLLESGTESVLFDTGYDDRETDLILDWAKTRLGKPVRRAVITHAHNDRLGGLGALRHAGIPAVALGTTVQRAAAAGLIAAAGKLTPGGGDPGVVLDSIVGLAQAARPDGSGFELFFPGAGHSPDNIVAYFPAQHVLFGGCLLKPDTATTTGNVADADVAEWPKTVARVAARYRAAQTVIPGHGAISGRTAFGVTESLITEKGPAAVEALRRRPNKQD